MIQCLHLLSARTKGFIMADIVKSGKTGNGPMAMGSRDWDSLLEMGDGRQVVTEFLKLFRSDPELQTAVKANDRHIGIENWLNDPQYMDGNSDAREQRPAIVVYTNEGLFEGVAGTIDADVAVVDFDTEGGSKEHLMNLPDGEEIYMAAFRVGDGGVNESDAAIIAELRQRNDGDDCEPAAE